MNLNLEQKAEKLITDYGMIEGGDIILVAFSGGSDSSALLYFLIKYFGEDKKDKIFATHMNHMIRGEDADKDERFAIETCEKYNIKIFVGHKNIPEIAAETKKSIEEAARDERYDFLQKIAGSIGGNVKTATAHTASDNTETVIFNLSRGCGLTGLSGIPPVNKNKNIIRPFLSCSKEDILEYCEKNNISYVEDKSNSDENYTRNFIRHNIAFKLKEKFNNLDENIFKSTEIMRDTAGFLDLCADNIIKNHDKSDKSNKADIDAILSSHKALQRAIITKLYENAVFPETRKLEFKHILYIEELLKDAETSKNPKKFSKSIDLPGFVTASVCENKLIFERIADKKTSGKRK